MGIRERAHRAFEQLAIIVNARDLLNQIGNDVRNYFLQSGLNADEYKLFLQDPENTFIPALRSGALPEGTPYLETGSNVVGGGGIIKFSLYRGTPWVIESDETDDQNPSRLLSGREDLEHLKRARVLLDIHLTAERLRHSLFVDPSIRHIAPDSCLLQIEDRPGVFSFYNYFADARHNNPFGVDDDIEIVYSPQVTDLNAQTFTHIILGPGRVGSASFDSGIRVFDDNRRFITLDDLRREIPAGQSHPDYRFLSKTDLSVISWFTAQTTQYQSHADIS